MKIIQDNTAVTIEGDVFETIATKVDSSKLIKLYGMLSNIYRNPIGSIVREYTSNAHDANIEAYNFKHLKYDEACKKYPWLNSDGSKLHINEKDYYKLQVKLTKADKDEPIIIGIDGVESMFYVKDYGIGLSPERMQHVFFSYLSSTKEDTDDEIGGFGIGAKSALAYTDTFFIDTVYCGVLYKYMMTKDETGMPVGKFMLSKETTEDNGTTIKVPIKEYSDQLDFITEIDKKLLYIPNIFVDGDISQLLNESKILKGNGWAISTASPKNSTMHIILDNIHYDIDWNEIGMRSINVPIGLVFKTGEILPTPSRESVLYTKASRELIVNTINLVTAEIYEIYRKEVQPTDNLFKAFKSYKNAGNDFLLDEDTGIIINAKELFSSGNSQALSGYQFTPYANWKPFMDTQLSFDKLKQSSVNIMNNIGVITLYSVDTSDMSVNLRETSYYTNSIYNQLSSMSVNNEISVISKSIFTLKEAHHFIEKNIDEIRTAGKANGNRSVAISIYRPRKLDSLDSYKTAFVLNNIGKKYWRNTIIAFQKILKEVEDRSLKAPMMNPNWEKLYHGGKCMFQPKAKTYVPAGNLFMKIYRGYFEDTASNKVTLPFTELESYKDFDKKQNIIYGSNKDIKKIRLVRDYYTILYSKSRSGGRRKYRDYTDFTGFIAVSVKDYKILKKMNLNKWVDINDMVNGKYKTIVRLATALWLKKRIEKFAYFDNNSNSNSFFRDRFYDEIKECRKYVKDNFTNFYNDVSWSKKDEVKVIIKEMSNLIEENNYLDQNIISKYNFIKKHIDRSGMCHVILSDHDGLGNIRDNISQNYIAKRLIKEGVPVHYKFYDNLLENTLAVIIDDYEYKSRIPLEYVILEEPTIYNNLEIIKTN